MRLQARYHATVLILANRNVSPVDNAALCKSKVYLNLSNYAGMDGENVESNAFLERSISRAQKIQLDSLNRQLQACDP